ncbi:hypothetical protein D0867_14636 [Hortaea werneckii]|uniref:PH domain-containing protein n=1 Tax=Hortaea werneckii TaxID=91943 RepID=A0A3M6XNL8_HORWE|nr:hypothetical protein D0867_14636 [Hortaea werneckii]RMY11536.1 hypothetical protein D0866_14333 [Hortaea werneckii]
MSQSSPTEVASDSFDAAIAATQSTRDTRLPPTCAAKRDISALRRRVPFAVSMGPGETLPDSAFSSPKAPRDLPSFHVSADSETRRHHRKSLRTRPSQLLEGHHAEPLSPLKQADHSQRLQTRQPAMSLFSLFSKPKVEKAHGYAESGIIPLPSRRALDEDGSRHSRQYLSTPVGIRDGEDPPFRAPSALSFRGRGNKSHRIKNATPVPQVSRKHVPNEALPLFQAFPQATKYGVLEVSTMSAETVLQKSRSRRTAGSQSSIGDGFSRASVEDTGSMDTRRAAKTTMKHFASGSISHEELPSKMFVLINSGYLLQYREDGPSNRLPEKVLELGEESAAFACDLIPGKHHVLQVSQAVDSQGVMLAPTSSLLSRLRFRSAADKLPASHFLLVMPSAKEMEKWMAALREEIEGVGGKEARVDTAVRPWTEEVTGRDGFNELKKTPKRSESRQSGLQDEEKSETATLDGIERQADQLAEGAQTSLHRNAPEHDAQSTSSSIALSEQQKRLSSIGESRLALPHARIIRRESKTFCYADFNAERQWPLTSRRIQSTQNIGTARDGIVSIITVGSRPALACASLITEETRGSYKRAKPPKCSEH